MSSKATRLGLSNSPLPTITPHLMPFHVEHTGSAPISTYFIVKPVSQPDNTSPSLMQHIKTRFTSTFRGRKMQGLRVNLPDGYSGAVLHTEELGMVKGNDSARKKRLPPPKVKGQKGGRTTRSSTRNNVDDTLMDEDRDVTMEGESSEGVIHTLRPISKFSSFTLWNPDVDVDEGRDEYLRALSEYHRLSAEVHWIDP